MLLDSIITILLVGGFLASAKSEVPGRKYNSSGVLDTNYRSKYDIVLPKNDAHTFLKRTKRASYSELKEMFREECCEETCDGEELKEMRGYTNQRKMDKIVCDMVLKKRKSCKTSSSSWGYPVSKKIARGFGFPSSKNCPNPCKNGLFHCGLGSGNKCYPTRVKCDSTVDCENGKDEKDCDITFNNNKDKIVAGTRLAFGAQQYCDIKVGLGNGASETQADMLPADCIAHCLDKAASNRDYTGVTINNGNGRTCICRKRTNYINTSNRNWLSCIFQSNLEKPVTKTKCTWHPGDGTGGSSTYEGNKNAAACIKHCLQKRKTNPTINGVDVNDAGTSCYCEYSMTSIQSYSGWNSCKFDLNVEVPTPAYNTPPCTLQSGDGSGGSERKEAYMSPAMCVRHCFKRSKEDPRVNGVSASTSGNKCYCESNMNKVVSYSGYKSCQFPAVKIPTTTCNLTPGDGIGGTEEQQSNMNSMQCIRRCLYLAETDPTVNGVTHKSSGNKCYCEYNMKSIKSYSGWKSCKLNIPKPEYRSLTYKSHKKGTGCRSDDSYYCGVKEYKLASTKEECMRMCTMNDVPAGCEGKGVCKYAVFSFLEYGDYRDYEKLGRCLLADDSCEPNSKSKSKNRWYQVHEKLYENLALGKPTLQSGSGKAKEASKGNDGNKYQSHNPLCAITPAAANPYWMVDMSKNVKIDHIRMYLSMQHTYKNVKLWTKTESDDWLLLKSYSKLTPKASSYIELKLGTTPRTARFVKISLHNSESTKAALAICELDVYGRYQDPRYCDLTIGYRGGGPREYMREAECIGYCMRKGSNYVSLGLGRCYCATAMSYHSTSYTSYKTCKIGSNQPSITMGRTNWGTYKKKQVCPAGSLITGFRVQVGSVNDRDKTGINGLQLRCTDGTITSEQRGPFGNWKAWKTCDGGKKLDRTDNYVTGFNYRSMASQSSGKDDSAATDIRMTCSNGATLNGGGHNAGTWHSTSWTVCKGILFPCGIQVQVEKDQSTGDDTGMNHIRIICCSSPMKHSITMGKTDFGSYKLVQMCRPGNAVTGFRIKVDKSNSGDKSGLNGVQIACTDGQTTRAEPGLKGQWKAWKYCDGSKKAYTDKYVTGFNYKSASASSGNRIAATNIKMKCNNNVDLMGDGHNSGKWERSGWGQCISQSYLCGVQVQTGYRVSSDYTGMNHIRFICCSTSQPSPRPSPDPYTSPSAENIVYSGNVYVLGRPVCDLAWDKKDAKVICKSLGFATDTRALPFRYSKFGIVNKDFILTRSACEGYETHIGACPQETAATGCVGTEAAGVTCIDPKSTKLLGGMDSSEGNVYIINQPVCGHNWGLKDAKVVCNSIFKKQFKLRKNEGVPVYKSFKDSKFGRLPSSGRSINNVNCRGSESNLGQCTFDINVPCEASKRAGVQCAKCTPEALLKIINTFKLGVFADESYKLIIKAMKMLSTQCLKWDCSQAPQMYPEYCTIQAFLIDAKAIMESLKQAKKIVYLKTTINYGEQIKFLFQKQGFGKIQNQVYNLGDQISSFQTKLASYFKNTASFEERRTKEDLRMITNRWQVTKEDIATRLRNLKSQMRDIFAFAYFMTAAELVESAADLAAVILDAANLLKPVSKTKIDIKNILRQMAKVGGTIAKLSYALDKSAKAMNVVIDRINRRTAIYQKKFGKIQALLESTDDSKGMTMEDARQYLKNYNNFALPIWPGDIAEYDAQLTNMVTKSCAVIENPNSLSGATAVIAFSALGGCPKAKANQKVVIANYGLVFAFVKDVKAKLSTIAQAKVAQGSSKRMSEVLGLNLRSEIDKQIVRRNVLLLLQLEQATFVKETCNYITYWNHAKQTQFCTDLLKNPGLNLGPLIAFKYNTNMCKCSGCKEHPGVFNIPAIVPNPGTPVPKGTIDLSLIYQTDATTGGTDGWFNFKIPNIQWLRNNGWISNYLSSNGPFFLQRFEPYYPPVAGRTRHYTVYTDMRLQVNEVNGRSYPIDPTVKFSFHYKENLRRSCDGKKYDDHPYKIDFCPNLGAVCAVQRGNINGLIYPSLVGSTWRIRVRSGAILTKPSPADTFNIKVRAAFCYKSNTYRRRDSLISSKTKRNTNTCCYSQNKIISQNGDCNVCPANSKSRLGGYYCEKCGAGYEPSKHNYGCVPCPVGKYKADAGPGSCQACPVGSKTTIVGQSICFKQSAFTCTLSPGDGTGGNPTWEGWKAPDECIRHCIQKMKTNPTINGVDVDDAGTKCYCEHNMTSIRSYYGWQTCKLEPRLKCTLSVGIGVGGTETFEGNMATPICIQYCIRKRKTNPTINGVTVNDIGTKCYCEYSMKRINYSRSSRSCKFEHSNNHLGCTESDKCGNGQGECDAHSQCKSGLNCGKNNCNQGSGIFTKDSDCCYKPNKHGGGSACTELNKCGDGEGDCDSTSQCKSGLVCGTNNCDQSIGIFNKDSDCCWKPTKYGGPSACTASDMCGEGQGDCDKDSQCESGLKCGKNNCDQKIFTFNKDTDCCYKP